MFGLSQHELHLYLTNKYLVKEILLLYNYNSCLQIDSVLDGTQG